MKAKAGSAQKPESQAGRMCPLDYYYEPAAFARAPDFAAEVLYVVGGLYGNLAAIDALETLVSAEQAPVTIVFNGDFHWFDAERKWFNGIETRVAPYRTLRGNVETEISRTRDIGAGCGCAYPPAVDDDTVRCSNQILAALRSVVHDCPAACARLSKLPMHLVVAVGGVSVRIVHGDAEALAGWRFANDALDSPGSLPWLEGIRRQSQINVFASTHTCLAVSRDYFLPSGLLTVINSGAAGMPNFSSTKFGLISRISAQPSPNLPLYGTLHNGIHIDAIALDYNTDAFLKLFLSRWPDGTSAHQSYFERIANGPAYDIAQARPRVNTYMHA
jgi:hypothetical protein